MLYLITLIEMFFENIKINPSDLNKLKSDS